MHKVTEFELFNFDARRSFDNDCVTVTTISEPRSSFANEETVQSYNKVKFALQSQDMIDVQGRKMKIKSRFGNCKLYISLVLSLAFLSCFAIILIYFAIIV